MHSAFRSLLISGFLLSLPAAVYAAPPSSCAKKFVGTWQHNGIGGIKNTAILKANGQAECRDNPACVQGTWTCNGNVLSYNNGMYSTDYTLQPNGTMTARDGITVTRMKR